MAITASRLFRSSFSLLLCTGLVFMGSCSVLKPKDCDCPKFSQAPEAPAAAEVAAIALVPQTVRLSAPLASAALAKASN